MLPARDGRCVGMATADAGEVAEWIGDARVLLIPRNGRVRCLRCAAESTSVGGLPIARCLKVVSLETSSFLGILVIEMCSILSWHIEWTVDVTISRCWPVG